MFEKEELKELCEKYGIHATSIGDVIDTSHGDDDIRLNYNIDNEYFLKINNHKAVTEAFISNMNSLMERYRAIGVYCPKLYKNMYDKYLYNFSKDDVDYICYVEEYAKFKFYDKEKGDLFQFKKNMLSHVGTMAIKYTNQYLVSTRSMWTLIQLSPYDTDIDEKEENLLELAKVLKENNYVELGEKFERLDILHRNNIKKYLDELPRCVYQGDLNPSNMLVDESNNFMGIVDFNMFGTEVNINCFINEAMYYLENEDFQELTAKEILDKMENHEKDLIKVMLQHYKLSEVEKMVYDDYRWVIYASFYPNVQTAIDLIKQHKYEEKVIELLELLCMF